MSKKKTNTGSSKKPITDEELDRDFSVIYQAIAAMPKGYQTGMQTYLDRTKEWYNGSNCKRDECLTKLAEFTEHVNRFANQQYKPILSSLAKKFKAEARRLFEADLYPKKNVTTGKPYYDNQKSISIARLHV